MRIREEIEQWEYKYLSPYASKSAESAGRDIPEEEFFENGKMKIDINIWTGFIIIDIDDLIVEQSNPVILPPDVEKELRYILNMQ